MDGVRRGIPRGLQVRARLDHGRCASRQNHPGRRGARTTSGADRGTKLPDGFANERMAIARKKFRRVRPPDSKLNVATTSERQSSPPSTAIDSTIPTPRGSTRSSPCCSSTGVICAARWRPQSAQQARTRSASSPCAGAIGSAASSTDNASHPPQTNPTNAFDRDQRALQSNQPCDNV